MDVPSFLIRNGSNDFLNKQKNLFDVLDLAEKETKASTVAKDQYMEVEQKSKKRKRKETKQFRGKESLFKEPVDLPPRFRKGNKIPDFQKNPHKWVKYSLGDITQDDLSNESNTAAALAFLREIRIRKKKAADEAETDGSENKIAPPNSHQFCLKRKQEEATVDDKNSNKPVFKSSKLIMPEYVIGQSKKEAKETKKKILFKEKGKEVFLNHIHEYEDE